MSDAGVYCPVEENRVPGGSATRVHSMAIPVARGTPESNVEVEVFSPDAEDESGLTGGEDLVIREHSVTSPIAKRTPVPERQVEDFPPWKGDIDGLVCDDDLAIRVHSMARHAVNEELMNVRSRAEDEIVEYTSSVAGVDDFPEAEVGVVYDLSVRTNSTHSAASRKEVDISTNVESGSKSDSPSSVAGVDDPPEDEVCVAGVDSTSPFIAEEHSADLGMYDSELYDKYRHHSQEVDDHCDSEKVQVFPDMSHEYSEQKDSQGPRRVSLLRQMRESEHQVAEEQNWKIRELAEVSKVHSSRVSMSWDWSRVISEWIGEKQHATTKRMNHDQSGRFLDIYWNPRADAFLVEVDILNELRVDVEGEDAVLKGGILSIVRLNDPAMFVVLHAFRVQDGQRPHAKWKDNIPSKVYDRGRQWHGVFCKMGNEEILRSTCTCFHITVRRTIGVKQLERSSIAFERVLETLRSLLIRTCTGELVTWRSRKSGVPWGADARAINGSVRRIRAIVSLGNVEEMVTPELKLPATQGGVLRRITSPNALATLSGLFRRSTSLKCLESAF